MLVFRTIGDCPGCGGTNTFGNVSVGQFVLRGCTRCKYSTRVFLPEVRKKVLYLDQFFLSGAFKEQDSRFVEAAALVAELTDLQLLVVPFSTVHEDETHLWRGYDGRTKEELYAFIKKTARGHKFEPAYEIDRHQLMNAFKRYLADESAAYIWDTNEAVRTDIHRWEDFTWIDVGSYMGDIEQKRELKDQAVGGLVDLFPKWRVAQTIFAEDVEAELAGARQGYWKYYLEYLARLRDGDYDALFDAPLMSMVVESLVMMIRDKEPIERLQIVGKFMQSDHFKQCPYQWLSARIFAVLKDMVKLGAFPDRERALARHSGFFEDTTHIATYAPYCDAIVMDKAMGDIVSDRRIDLANRYQVKVFTLNNWEALLGWLEGLKSSMTEEHKAAHAAAYP